MTPLKKTLIIVAAIVALLVLVVALVFLPGVQLWALKRAMPGAEAEHVSAGMSSAEVRNLTLLQDGARITVPVASAEYSAWSYLTGGGVQVSSISANGVVVDLREYSPPTTADEPATFEGLLGALMLPAGLKLDAADIDAEVILAAPGVPEGRRAHMTIKGGGVGAGAEAAFDYEMSFTDPSAGAIVSAVKATGRLVFAAATDGSINSVTARAELQATGEGIPAGERIVIEAGSRRDAGGPESFVLTVARRSAGGAETQLLSATSAFNAGTRAWEGTWAVEVDDERLASVLNPQTAPDFEISGSGRYSINPETSETAGSGEVNGWVSDIERIMPELAGVGKIAFSSAFSGSADAKTARLETARSSIKTERGETLFSAAIAQAVEIALDTLQATVADAAAPAAKIEFGDLPLAWVEPFVAGSKLSGAVTGGAIDLFFGADGYSVSTTEPVTLSDVSASIDGKPMVERIDALWDGRVTAGNSKEGPSMTASVRSLEVRQGTATLLSLKGDFATNGATSMDGLRGNAKGTLEANLGALLAQPAAAEWRHLEAGLLSAEFDVSAAEAITVRLQAVAKSLVAMQEQRPLGEVSATIDARINVGKDGEFRVPLKVVNAGRESDVVITGSFAQRGESLALTAHVEGETLYVEDMVALTALVPSEEAPADGAPNTTRDEKPFWSGTEGTIELDIKQVVQSPEYPITNLRARAVIAAERIALEDFSGTISGSPVTAAAALSFETAAPRPYELDGRFKVPGLDLSAFFRAAEPNKPPTLESIVVAEGTMSGRGLNLDDLLARVQGRVDVAGGKGVYRGLARSSERISTGAGIVGALLGGQKVQDATQAVTELAAEMRELRFDRMTLKLARGDDLKLNIETLELASSTIRLAGKGVVNMEPDIPLVRQAQRLEMRIGFKDSLAERMVRSRMTDGTVDDLGYARFRVPIVLTGNLMSPDSKQFWEAVTRSMMEMGVQSFMGGG